jgi:hypothetical protein
MTGAGKEAMASGIDKLVNAVALSVPTASEFIGPSNIASGQALYKYMANKSQCFVSVLGEFGKTLEIMSSKNANSAEKQLIKELLNLYNKSGNGQNARPSIYADQEKNTITIQSPSFSILGESTPETLYGALTEDMITDGLLPRFMLIEYTGKRPSLNEHHTQVQPSLILVEKLAQLMANAKTLMHNHTVTNIDRTDEAAKLLADFDKLADTRINDSDKEVVRQLWNRAHIKILKLSALIAVGVNYIQPTITAEYVLWAKRMIEHDIKALSFKFEQGEVGRNNEETKQYNDMLKAIREYVTRDFAHAAKYRGKLELHKDKVVCYTYLNDKLKNMASFKNDKNGPTNALKKMIQSLLSDGIIVEITSAEKVKRKYTHLGKCYAVINV